MISATLIKIALIIIVIRSGYVALNLFMTRSNINILDLLYHISIIIIVLSFLI
ncbi:hypothetical protein [Alkalihalobacterium alkalinitrilicum]|uniref:hypothetical protein n=1 Tax=Alkalihalobacterium alkalinitrilicum TaxID=427920 RepID=UPI000A97C889|nr:hypothetical protein [Alkalihalobacterium alkalinitrilicum]